MPIDPYKLIIFSIIKDMFPLIIIEEETWSDFRKYYLYQKGYDKFNDSLIYNCSPLVLPNKEEYLCVLRLCIENKRMFELPKELWNPIS